MITLLTHPEGPITFRQKVLLDVTIKDIKAPPDDVRDLFKDAKAQSRKVGCIQRYFGGDTYFSYEPSNQAQHEINLIAALATPKSDVHITPHAGGCTEWKKY